MAELTIQIFDELASRLEPLKERLRTLLAKNRERTLTLQETGELDVYEQLEHLMILLKAYAIKCLQFQLNFVSFLLQSTGQKICHQTRFQSSSIT